MGSIQDHRKCAEECVAMAHLSDDDNDKMLWLTLAQSWVRLAEHVARVEIDEPADDEDGAQAALAGPSEEAEETQEENEAE